MARNKLNDQSRFHLQVALHIVIYDHSELQEINRNGSERLNLHLSSTNALYLNIWEELNKE